MNVAKPDFMCDKKHRPQNSLSSSDSDEEWKPVVLEIDRSGIRNRRKGMLLGSDQREFYDLWINLPLPFNTRMLVLQIRRFHVYLSHTFQSQ